VCSSDLAENRNGQSALMWAIAEGRTAIAKQLISSGANVNAVSKHGFTPVLFAAQRGDLAALQALITANANPLYKAPDGSTAFQIALSRGYAPLVTLLLDKGAEVNGRDRNGGTPLHEAVRQGKLDLVRNLVAKGADLHARTEQPKGAPASPFRTSAGMTPFLTAAEAGKDASKAMVAQFGRAKTLGDACIGFPDAGAMSVTVIIGAFADYIAA
jgi:ankyrin repeat protein